MPVANAQLAEMDIFGRSASADEADTQWDVDLMRTVDMQAFALLLRNPSVNAGVRLQISDTAGDFSSPLYDTNPGGGFIDYWPAGLLPEDAPDNLPFRHVAPAVVSGGRYVRWLLSDETNVDGFLDVTRALVTQIYQPTYNMAFGARWGLVTRTVRTETDGRGDTYQEKPARKRAVFTLENIPEAEAFLSALRMQRRHGISRQLFVQADPDDATLAWVEKDMFCTFDELSAVEQAHHDADSIGFALLEAL